MALNKRERKLLIITVTAVVVGLNYLLVAPLLETDEELARAREDLTLLQYGSSARSLRARRRSPAAARRSPETRRPETAPVRWAPVPPKGERYNPRILAA